MEHPMFHETLINESNFDCIYQLIVKMGLWAWMTNQIFTKKFWSLVKKEGLLQTYTRGHKAVMHAHSVGGYTERSRLVGQDEFGNKYYEDYGAFHPHQRRWVEFADYLTLIGNNGDRIPPKWHGWLSHTYDDIPTYGARQFVQTIYQKPHTWMLNPRNIYVPPSTVYHQKNHEFFVGRRNRYAEQWQGATMAARGLPTQSLSVNKGTASVTNNHYDP